MSQRTCDLCGVILYSHRWDTDGTTISPDDCTDCQALKEWAPKIYDLALKQYARYIEADRMKQVWRYKAIDLCFQINDPSRSDYSSIHKLVKEVEGG